VIRPVVSGIKHAEGRTEKRQTDRQSALCFHFMQHTECQSSLSGQNTLEDDCLLGFLRRVVWQKFTDVLEVFAASIIRAMSLMMEPANTSETSVNLYQTTQRNNPKTYIHSYSPPSEPEIRKCTCLVNFSRVGFLL
jgi:hypothetical protein